MSHAVTETFLIETFLIGTGLHLAKVHILSIENLTHPGSVRTIRFSFTIVSSKADECSAVLPESVPVIPEFPSWAFLALRSSRS